MSTSREMDVPLPFDEAAEQVVREMLGPQAVAPPLELVREPDDPQGSPRVHTWTDHVMHRSVRQDWCTPLTLFEPLHAEFRFDVDLAASKDSALLCDWFGPDHDDPQQRDALQIDWHQHGRAGFCNPPYRNVRPWTQKALVERAQGFTTVLLLASRTGARWFHELKAAGGVEFRFLKGRVRFVGATSGAPFDSVVVVVRPVVGEGGARFHA